jgi:hypothetical protein
MNFVICGFKYFAFQCVSLCHICGIAVMIFRYGFVL